MASFLNDLIEIFGYNDLNLKKKKKLFGQKWFLKNCVNLKWTFYFPHKKFFDDLILLNLRINA